MIKPDLIIGDKDKPYLLRWHVIPRNPLFNVYLHKILRDDDDRALHDHPWPSLSIILRGGYIEVTASGTFWRRPGAFIFRRATTAHRLALPVVGGGIRYCWSLFITGPKVREWGFHCPQGWRHWKEFVDTRDRGQIGRGCA